MVKVKMLFNTKTLVIVSTIVGVVAFKAGETKGSVNSYHEGIKRGMSEGILRGYVEGVRGESNIVDLVRNID